MIELKNIDKYYNIGTVNEICLFKDFNLKIQNGDFVSVIGSNGSGKTSMLNLICGSLQPEKGSISLGGEGYHKAEGVCPPKKDRKSLSGPGYGNLSFHDNS